MDLLLVEAINPSSAFRVAVPSFPKFSSISLACGSSEWAICSRHFLISSLEINDHKSYLDLYLTVVRRNYLVAIYPSSSNEISYTHLVN